VSAALLVLGLAAGCGGDDVPQTCVQAANCELVPTEGDEQTGVVDETLAEPLVVTVDGGPKKRIEKALDAKVQLDAGRSVFVLLHYDLLPRAPAPLINALADFLTQANAVICDESHALKNRQAQRTQAVGRIVDRSRPAVRILATGTPIRNQADDLYSQIELLRPKTWISYADFESRYLETFPMEISLPNGRTKMVKHVVGSKNLNELNRVVQTVQVRRKKTDVLDLPEMIESFPRLELDKASQHWYKNLRERAVLALSELEPSLTLFDPKAQTAMEQAIRCAQICQGYIGGWEDDHADVATMIDALHAIPNARENDLAIPGNSKLEWISEHVQEVVRQGNQAIIFGNFNSPLYWLQHHLSEVSKVEFIHGGLSTSQRHEAVQRFQAGEVRILISQVAIAEGWTATAAQDAFFLGRSWSPAVNEQAQARLHRIGQQGMVNIHTPIMAGTIEEAIHRKLSLKGDSADRAIRTTTIGQLINDL
jgi:SNF2 family DNA or RNA helicase